MQTKRFTKLVLLLFVISFTNCERDFTDEENTTTVNLNQNNKFQIKTGKNVSSKVLSFLKQKTNNSLKVELKTGKIALTNNENFLSRESALGIIDTSKELVVNNEFNVKHTFKVITEGDTNSVLNIIVVETVDGVYECFMSTL
jgi:hypothetical protein